MLDLARCSVKTRDSVVEQARWLMADPAVVSLGIGEKRRLRRGTDRLALIVGVLEKQRDARRIPPGYRVPTRIAVRIDGREREVETDVVTMRRPRLSRYQGYVRPAFVGYDVAAPGGTRGTLGPLLRDQSGVEYLLSNAHVLTDLMRHVTFGGPILQPSQSDASGHIVGKLARYTRLRWFGDNPCDAALATLVDGQALSAKLADGSVIAGIDYGVPEVGDPVRIVGSTSGASSANVRETNVTRQVLADPRGTRKLLLTQQIDAGQLGANGDSGACVLDRDGYLIGLFVADGMTGDLFIPIERVLSTLADPARCEAAAQDRKVLSFTVLAP